ncbi:MAG TPA: D-glycerate dehydrogenase [Candidatus Eisenbacteria bacterium]|jgi:glyoxylate reductase|nr:D-glycerate dehydrogenase [Candidatus Eisenbacteria bacterium]
MSEKKRIFVTRRIPDAGLDLLKARADFEVIVYGGEEAIPRADLLAGVKGADAVLSILTEKIDAELLDAAGPQLKIVSNFAVGFDNVDLAAAAAHRVMVTNTPGVLTDAVAEHAIALMMAVARRIPESERFARAGKYKAFGPMLLLGAQLKGKTLGVIGLGRIGEGVAERAAKGLGMKVLYNDVRRDERFEGATGAEFRATAEDVLKEADVVSIHVPLLPTTRHLINAERLAMMKKTAYLVNTSRGPVVDEAALAAALKGGVIAGAAIDVFENEPNIDPGLLELDNVVITPHTASATIEARSAMATLAAQAVIDALDGNMPLNLVKPKV